ncbi:efflux RND transporter periplasmic adaptor subunit [candidate division KSB1 bacterium]|nr:efflux RND transporter periplasmic adaptor subunit [candidate division KSB1 bacterium]
MSLFSDRKLTSLLLGLLLTGFTGPLGCKHADSTAAKLRTAVVERGDIVQTVVATGRVRPLQQIEIRSKSGGTVRKLYVEEGDFVEKGQKLFEISPESSPSEQVRAREDLRNAEVQVRETEDKLRIAKELFDKSLSPEQDYLEAQRAVDRAHARLAAAEAEWALIQREQLGESQSEDKNLDIVRTSTTVLAPISGLIFTREIDEGASVTPTTSASGGTVVMTMGDDEKLEFRGDIDEADVGKMRLGIDVAVTVQAFPGKPFTGTITHISPVGKLDADEDRQTVFGVRARVENPEKLLRVGMSATAKIVVDESKDVPIVDEIALVFQGDSTFVRIVEDSALAKTRLQVVKLGISNGIRASISEGLSGGEVVSLGNSDEDKKKR